VLDEGLPHSIASIRDVLIALDDVELRVNTGVFSFQGFGQVRNISRASSGCLYVDFKKASVAETVCHVSLIFPFFWFRFCVSSFGFFFLWFWFRFWLYGVVGR
jgi:hypothetical protein